MAGFIKNTRIFFSFQRSNHKKHKKFIPFLCFIKNAFLSHISINKKASEYKFEKS